MASVERQVQSGPLGDGEAEGVYHVVEEPSLLTPTIMLFPVCHAIP